MATTARQKGQPNFELIHEFQNIITDLSDPKNAVREAINNGIDWHATELQVKVYEDKTRPDEELILEVEDNGDGLDNERLAAFFSLAKSTSADPKQPWKSSPGQSGHKGHGTKTYFNSRQIEVWSSTKTQTVYAIMGSPLQKIMQLELPGYEFDIESKPNDKTGTRILIRGLNMNQRKQDFGHNVLRDYILWFTRFASVEREFGLAGNTDKRLYLQGLGYSEPEGIKFGHLFPKETTNFKRLRDEHPGEWPKLFVKRWLFKSKAVINHPTVSIDLVFYIEGDGAKREYNNMLRVRGKVPQYGMYKVEDRYGLWACKDFVPIKRYNEWLGLGKRLETKYHAFVNCEEFRLTANRGDISSTPPQLLADIAETVRQIFIEDIQRSAQYSEYEDAVELEEQYESARQEGEDFTRRRKRAMEKKMANLGDLKLFEPATEMGVIALFNQVY